MTSHPPSDQGIIIPDSLSAYLAKKYAAYIPCYIVDESGDIKYQNKSHKSLSDYSTAFMDAGLASELHEESEFPHDVHIVYMFLHDISHSIAVTILHTSYRIDSDHKYVAFAPADIFSDAALMLASITPLSDPHKNAYMSRYRQLHTADAYMQAVIEGIKTSDQTWNSKKAFDHIVSKLYDQPDIASNQDEVIATNSLIRSTVEILSLLDPDMRSNMLAFLLGCLYNARLEYPYCLIVTNQSDFMERSSPRHNDGDPQQEPMIPEGAIESTSARADSHLRLSFTDEMTRANRNQLHTVVFDDDEEYIRFTDHVWNKIDQDGWESTNVPIAYTIRVPRWVLEVTMADFAMRLVTAEDVRAAVRQLTEQGQRRDAESVKNFRVPIIKPGNFQS